MKSRIMIITSKYLSTYVKELIKKITVNSDVEYEIDVKIYDSFSNISEIYNKHAKNVDGVLVSGKIAKAAILKNKMDFIKPIVSFDVTIAEIYRAVINLMLDNRNIDLNRVIFDFQIPVGDEISVHSFLKNIDQDFPFFKIETWTKNLNLDHISIIEEQLKNEIIHLWQYKAIDFVICQYSSIIGTLEEYKIPFFYPLPTGEQMIFAIKKLLTMIDIENIRRNFPVILRIDLFKKNLCNIDKVGDLAQKFLKSNFIDCSIQKFENYIQTQLTVAQYMHITNNCKNSKLTKYLEDNEIENFVVSYGIGNNFYKALENSIIAKKESILRKKTYIVDENENLIGPLDSDNFLIVENNLDDEIIDIAKSCNLSTKTIQKVIAITEINKSKKISAAELSKQLGSSVRNANRILQNFVSGGYASVLLERTKNTKGRPTKIYRLDI